MSKATYIEHVKGPNRTRLLVSCLTCGKKTFQIPFCVHCDDCKKQENVAAYYYRKPGTMRWFSDQGYGI